MGLITFTNKVALNVNNDVADINKCNASDLNEIKSNVNDNATYSSTETEIGSWLGEKLYRKVINIGNLPNNNVKSVAHNISNLKEVTKICGVLDTGGNGWLPLPFCDTDNIHNSIKLGADDTYVSVETAIDYSYASAYVILEYTKTS